MDDFDFVVDTLGKDDKNQVALTELLADEETRDQILDDQVLFERVHGDTAFTKISPYFYFYILSRRAFLDFEIDDRDLTDYVASMLAQFCSTKRSTSVSQSGGKSYTYFTDMMQDFISASPPDDFLIRSHMGNYALFMTGLYPDYIYRKSTYGRKAPGFDYYEQMGSTSFRWASQHRMATKLSLVEILASLAEQFRHVRLALNRLSDEYIYWDDRPENMDKMLRQIFYGGQGQPYADS
jgi:hypothetical protein